MIDLQVRASSLTGFPDCERRFASRHIPAMIAEAGYELRRTPNTIGARVGTATHAGAALLLQTKIDTGETGPVDDACERAIESLRTEQDGVTLWDDCSPSMNDAEKQTIRMVRIYNLLVAPRIKPVAVEQEMHARFSPTLRLTGHMDVAEEEEIRDTKTGIGRRPNHPQYGAYSLLRRSNGHTVNRFFEDYVPRTPIKRTQGEPVSVQYPIESCEQIARRILTRIDTAVQAFAADGNPGAFMPNPSSMLCSAKYCPAFATTFCPYTT